VTGALGGRIDHILTHISLLIRYHETLQIRIRETGSEVRAVSGETTFAGEPGDTLSLTCFAPVVGATVEGVRWPLNDEILQPGSRPVSNEFLGASVRIMVRRGVLVASHVMKAHV
jgi:thiamine pyrophosphokinase